MKAPGRKKFSKSHSTVPQRVRRPNDSGAAPAPGLPQGAYLVDVREEDIHLDDEHPIHVRHMILKNQGDLLNAPHFHPYLELGIRFKGTGMFLVEGEAAMRHPYDIYFGAINQPHRGGTIRRYPVEFVAVHFLPGILSERGSDEDGIAIFDRFMAEQPLAKRLMPSPPALRAQLARGFRQMLAEFQGRDFGRMIKLRALLLQLLVDLFRWERRSGSWPEGSKKTGGHWEQVMKAMRYIQQHYAEIIYGPDVAAACGLNKTSLQAAFRQTLKIPWVRYLQLYRVHQAALLLRAGTHNVTEAASACGFESLGHFIRTFRSQLGTTPRTYLSKAHSKMDEMPQAAAHIRSSGRKRVDAIVPHSGNQPARTSSSDK